MDFGEYFQVGMKEEQTVKVEEQHTAAHVGSGSLRVLATPVMIAFMEMAARDLLARHAPQGYSSVGVGVDIRHLAPTPLGDTVRVVCEVVEVDGPKVNFAFQAWDSVEQVGAGSHQRVLIDEARFLQRVNAKAARVSEQV